MLRRVVIYPFWSNRVIKKIKFFLIWLSVERLQKNFVYTHCLQKNNVYIWQTPRSQTMAKSIKRDGKVYWIAEDGKEYADRRKKTARNAQLRKERRNQRRDGSKIAASGKSKVKQKRLALFKDYFGIEDGQKKYRSGMVISLRLNPSELEPVVRFAHRMKKKSLGEAVKFAIRKQFYGKRDIKRIDSVSTEAKTIEKANEIIELNKKLLIENNEYEKIIRKLIEMHDQFSIDRELHKDE